MSRHHVYPKRYRNEDTEIKLVTDRDHKLWHSLTDDEHGQAQHPLNAIRMLAKKFLPREMEDEFLKEVI